MMCEIFNNSAKAPAGPPLVDEIFSTKSFDDIWEINQVFLLVDEDASRRARAGLLLQWGGMPALMVLNAPDRRQWLKDYEHTYLEQDVADLVRLDDRLLFGKFQRLAALRSGCLLNYTELARDAAVSVDTAAYLEYLQSFLSDISLRLTMSI